jgi:dipeptidyl aminopeptidase/acylaminoacyl peptidase
MVNSAVRFSVPFDVVFGGEPIMRVSFFRLVALAFSVSLLLPAAAAAQNATRNEPLPALFKLPHRVADLSPDGKWILTWDIDASLCVYDAATLKQRVCGDTKSKGIHVNADDLVWSPDSTRIAVAESAFKTVLDGDLWVMDAATGKLTDLTDDGFTGVFAPFGAGAKAKLQGKSVYEDVLPAWSPDGKSIAFSRSSVINAAAAGNELAVVPAAGGPVKTLLKVSLTTQLGVIYLGMAWAPDAQAIAFTYAAPSKTDPLNGVWLFTFDGAAPRQVLKADPDLGRPAILSINATGTTGIVMYTDIAFTLPASRPFYWLLNLKTGARTVIAPPANAPKGAFVDAAVFSPDGTKLLFISKIGNPDESLVIRNLATGADQTIFTAPHLWFAAIGHGLDWAADGTILVMTDLNTGVLIHVGT